MLKKHPLTWIFVGTALVADLVSSFLAACQIKHQENPECAEKGYGLTETLAYRFFGWLFDLIESHDDFVIAAATVAIGIFTYYLYEATSGLLRHTRTVERAYLKMSHTGGLTFAPPGAVVQIRVKNFGRTPANVSRVLLTFVTFHPGDPIPVEPDYSDGSVIDSSSAFLVSGDRFHVNAPLVMSPETVADLCARQGVFGVLYGYVDYIDAFGVRHRNGYARRLAPGIKGNNLVFWGGNPFNYDHPRLRGEGTDWT